MGTFVLGVGAQKAGTTWLHRYLAQSPGWGPTLTKEFHVWDSIYHRTEPVFEGARAAERHDLHRLMVNTPDLYFDYFAELLSNSQITGDITPSYATLPAEALGRIRSGFEERGIAVRVIFLLRDPVERCWSAIRMYLRKGARLPGVGPLSDPEAALAAYCATSDAQRRGRYELTVAELEQAFPPEALYFGLSEKLSAEELSAHLGIPPQPDFAKRRLNEEPKTTALTEETRRKVARSFIPTFEFCWERFPITRSLWTSGALL